MKGLKTKENIEKRDFMRKKNTRKEQGITLIALVITIIILLILAGITISAITGDNGIIRNTKNAKEETEIANEKEIVEKATIQAMGNNKYGNIEESELQSELDKETDEGKTEVTNNEEELEVIFIESNRYYTVDKDGNVKGEYPVIEDKYPGDITFGKDGETLDGKTEKTAYQIWCIEDLIEWSKNYSKYAYSYIKLCTNLNFKSELSYANSETKDYGDVNQDGNIDILIEELKQGEGFKPIQQFSGAFDGNHHTISNIYISKQDNAGFILSLNNANFKNITIKGNIYSKNNAAGIISDEGNSHIENVKNYVEIYGGSAAGIIANDVKGSIKNCSNFANIESTSTVGGICGYINGGEMVNCTNQGTIKSSASVNLGVGGLCGNNYGNSTIKNCINQGAVIYDGNKSNWYYGGAGGIIGINNLGTLTIQNCVNTGKIQSTSYAGGICGMDLTYWQNQEKYELTNSFMLNNIEKVTGSNEAETEITVFEMEDIQDVITSLNTYIQNNKLTEQGWKLWKIGNDGKLTCE